LLLPLLAAMVCDSLHQRIVGRLVGLYLSDEVIGRPVLLDYHWNHHLPEDSMPSITVLCSSGLYG
jgi:hypothetical protein